MAMTADVSSDHRRINERLLEYWQQICAGRAFPSEGEIDPSAVSDIWDSCFLVAVNDRARERGFKYSYLGSSIIEAFGDDLTGVEVFTTLVDTANHAIIHKFEEVVRTGLPVIDESEFTNRRNVVIKYRSCMLPLGKVPGTVDYIIGGMKWKAF